MKILAGHSIALLSMTAFVSAQAPGAPVIVEAPGVTVLRGLTVHEFEAEMQLMTQALGLTCGSCHVRGNFASDDNPRKGTARRMLEMTATINRQFFPDHKPAEGESRLGKVTCFTCHRGSDRPKSAP